MLIILLAAYCWSAEPITEAGLKALCKAHADQLAETAQELVKDAPPEPKELNITDSVTQGEIKNYNRLHTRWDFYKGLAARLKQFRNIEANKSWRGNALDWEGEAHGLAEAIERCLIGE